MSGSLDKRGRSETVKRTRENGDGGAGWGVVVGGGGVVVEGVFIRLILISIGKSWLKVSGIRANARHSQGGVSRVRDS